MTPPLTPYEDDDLSASFSPPADASSPRSSVESTSTTSLILERVNNSSPLKRTLYDDPDAINEKDSPFADDDDGSTFTPIDLETGRPRRGEKRIRKWVILIAAILLGSWAAAFVYYVATESYRAKDTPHDPAATSVPKAGKKIDLEQIMTGLWRAHDKPVQWIEGERDGLMVVTEAREGYITVRDVKDEGYVKVLMKDRKLNWNQRPVGTVEKFWVAKGGEKVLVATAVQSHWRHSFSAKYWLVDVESQMAEPLVPGEAEKRLQLAVWSPDGKAVAYVDAENNLHVRKIGEETVRDVTEDGGTNTFNGIPDWVYEEEVFSGNRALWWSDDGKFLAFLRTDETEVPEYPLQYFVSRPSGKQPKEGLENYPELDFIKYPKAGAPNPVVNLKFYDIEKGDTFAVDIDNDFPDDDRLITEVVWAGEKVLIKGTNRESDVLKMSLVDVAARQGKTVREVNITAIDGGWFEVTEQTTFIPKDESKGRREDGYIDQVVHEGYNHLAYFSPLDTDQPVLLTKGKWEVVDAPSAVDLDNNVVYFVGTEKSSIERHLYSVKLDGSELQPVTDTKKDGYYGVSFSKNAGYALVSYRGPGVPYQKMIGTPAVDGNFTMEWSTNGDLEQRAREYELPTKHYSTVNIDGFELNVVERRPPHFDPKKKYPVLFYVYGGPGSQMVHKQWQVDFQAYVAGALDYLVVTVDGRGTGFTGRAARTAVRGNLGYWESHDQIETAKIWAKKKYVDEKRMAIWGWSYGGFLTLKTLERDAGQTFKYGMAVAPVTDWRYYDSIYTERYMHTPQHNPGGYENSTISDVKAVSENVRFLVMHGSADDNVHIQNTLTLIDNLDLAGVENYDVHFYPDSDHSIYFHNANRMVYDRLEQWLIRAFNGEYLKLADLKPLKEPPVITERE